MKKVTVLILTTIFCQVVFAQVSGNINYKNQVKLPDQNIDISTPSSTDIFISIKGLANIKANSYVAIFSVTQVGKTTEEVNELLDKRINTVLNEIKQKKGIETYVDMISFVPVYELEVERKLFSKKTYNEIPKGFELKKNIHIKYTDPDQLNDFINLLSNQEVYDLVRVDYYSDSLESVKRDLTNKAKIALQEKITSYETLLGVSFASFEKRVNDGFKIMLPVEMYKSYEAFSGSSLNLKKSSPANATDKSTTIYYQPIIDKEFDFVINPVILEPVIQVMYEIKIVINREKKPTQNDKEYYIITPNGEMKILNINK